MENIKLGIVGAIVSCLILICISDKEIKIKENNPKTEKDSVVLKKWM